MQTGSEWPRLGNLGSARQAPAFVAKATLAGVGVLAFVAAAVLGRVAFPGHAKKPITALAPPGRFVEIVRRNQLESGMLAPAQADPAAATAQT